MRHRSFAFILLGLLTLAIPLLAATLEEGPILKGKVADAKLLDESEGNWALNVTLVDDPRAPGKYADTISKGSNVFVNARGQKRRYKEGDSVQLRWRWFNDSSKKEPIDTLGWHLVEGP